MKAEYSLKDFKGVMKNPFYDKLITEVVVPVRTENNRKKSCAVV